jgi:hypothetical protein
MGRIAVALLTILLADAPAKSAPEPQAYGGLSCREIVEGDTGAFMWAQGFMNGVNFANIFAGQPIRDLSSIPIDAQQNRLIRFCHEHPDTNYQTAVANLYEALKINARSQH